MIITISGTPGAGKSSIAKIIEQELKATRVYAGSIMREKARAQSITLQELAIQAEKKPRIDEEVDREVAAMAHKSDDQKKIIIVEGRVQFHLIPKSIKIFITVSPEEGAKRIYQDLCNPQKNKERNEGTIKTTKEQVLEETQKRQEQDRARFQKLYKIDYTNPANYDLIIDTTSITLKEAAEQIIEYIKQ